MKPTEKKPKKSEKGSPDETSDELLDENINEDDTAVSELSDDSSEVVAAENETTVAYITDKTTDSDSIASPDSTTEIQQTGFPLSKVSLSTMPSIFSNIFMAERTNHGDQKFNSSSI